MRLLIRLADGHIANPARLYTGAVKGASAVEEDAAAFHRGQIQASILIVKRLENNRIDGLGRWQRRSGQAVRGDFGRRKQGVVHKHPSTAET